MRRIHIAAVGLAFVLLLVLVGAAWAGSSAHYEINWQVISAGGAPSSVGNVTVNATLGQTAIGMASSSHYELSSGYWAAMAEIVYDRFLFMPFVRVD